MRVVTRAEIEQALRAFDDDPADEDGRWVTLWRTTLNEEGARDHSVARTAQREWRVGDVVHQLSVGGYPSREEAERGSKRSCEYVSYPNGETDTGRIESFEVLDLHALTDERLAELEVHFVVVGW